MARTKQLPRKPYSRSITQMETSDPRSENHTMTGQKRDREVELENESDTSTTTNKRTRLNTLDSADHRQDHPEVCDSSLFIVWSQPMTETQKCFLVTKVEELVRLISASDYIKPQKGKHMTFLVKKNRKPMDLSTMSSHLKSGKYPSVKDLVIDFRIMICDVISTLTWTQERFEHAGRLWKCFCERMKHCPTGPQDEQMATYSKDAIELMASKIKTISAKSSTPSSEKPVDGSNENMVQNVFSRSEESPEELQDHSFIDVSESPSSIQNNIPHISGSEAVKTLEPGDLDEETRQLLKEIEERQQKLANMIDKKRLLAEIKNLDVAMAEVNVKIPEMEDDFRQIDLKIQELAHREDAAEKEAKAALDSGDWHNEQRERLQKEAERLWNDGEKHRQEYRKFSIAATEYLENAQALLFERNRVQKRGAQVLDDCILLKTKRDQLDSERAIVKKKLDELNDGGI